MSLEHIRIVLVNPSHPGNIGAVARAMKNMGLSALYLVAPARFPGPEASARASGAEDLLENARITDTLAQAIKDCHLVIGTSARNRRISWPALVPDVCANKLVVEAECGPAALVFGPERTGLSNDLLDQCHYAVTIPTNEVHPSLNLAGAVLIMGYEILLAQNRHQTDQGVEDGSLTTAFATTEDMGRFYEHLEQVLVQIGFLDPVNPRKLMRRLHRLFNRTRLDSNEVNILRGILTAVQSMSMKPDLDKKSRKLI